jgi:hypothetical protein
MILSKPPLSSPSSGAPAWIFSSSVVRRRKSLGRHNPLSHVCKEEAARYFDAFSLADEVAPSDEADGGTEEETAEPEEADAAEADEEKHADPKPTWLCGLDAALACGYSLKTRAAGWRLFCERLSLPPFICMKHQPGFDRLQRALERAKRAAFVPEGMLRWVNDKRPKDRPALAKVVLAAEGLADAFEKFHHERARF